MTGGDGKRYLGIHVYEGYPETPVERTDYEPLKYGSIVFRIDHKKKSTAASVYYLELFLFNKDIDVAGYFEAYKALQNETKKIEEELSKIEYEKEYWR